LGHAARSSEVRSSTLQFRHVSRYNEGAAMNTYVFAFSLMIAVVGPVMVVTYLYPILLKVLQSLCGGDTGAEFWIRSAYVMAVCGSLLLMLMFGEFGEHIDLLQAMRRTFIIVCAAIFLTVAIISSNVRTEVRRLLSATPAGHARDIPKA
jgi:hypothetical protein